MDPGSTRQNLAFSPIRCSNSSPGVFVIVKSMGSEARLPCFAIWLLYSLATYNPLLFTDLFVPQLNYPTGLQ